MAGVVKTDKRRGCGANNRYAMKNFLPVIDPPTHSRL
jgi:hypothetical protein